MKATSILFVIALCAQSAFAEQPTLKSLALKIEALERQVEELKTDLAATKEEKKKSEVVLDSARRPEIIVNILKDGRIRIEGQELRDEELTGRLKPILNVYPNQPIRIKADGEVKYQDVVRVVDLCQKAGGWNISFAS